MESPKEQLRKTLGLLQLERQADLEQYRQKVLLRPLQARVKEGMTWYPVRMAKEYIGTGERIIVEVERTTQKDQPHAFQSGKMVSVFSNASGKSEKQHQNGVINYVRDNLMVITLNGDDIPEWIDSGSLGVDVMFDEMSYREMEYTLKKVIEADDDRVAEFRELLLGVTDLYDQENPWAHYISNAIRAKELQKKDVNYIVRSGEIVIVDEFTGRVNTGLIYVNLVPKEQRSLTQRQFEEQTRRDFQKIPGARVSFRAQGGAGSTKDVAIILKSENGDILTQTAQKLEREMRALPGFVEVSSGVSLVKPEIIIQPDPVRAADQGVSVRAIARTASLALIGDNEFNLAKFNLADRQIPIRVKIANDGRSEIETLQNLRVPSSEIQ